MLRVTHGAGTSSSFALQMLYLQCAFITLPTPQVPSICLFRGHTNKKVLILGKKAHMLPPLQKSYGYQQQKY